MEDVRYTTEELRILEQINWKIINDFKNAEIEFDVLDYIEDVKKAGFQIVPIKEKKGE